MALFDNALAEMATGRKALEPQSFFHYAKHAGYPNIRTADRISIQTYLGLASELKEAGVMIFRLGNYTKGHGTWFALAKHFGSWSDYFLLDKQLFAHCPQTEHTWYREDLRIFEVLPKSTETSLVNLAVASGIMSTALGLDSDSGAIVNATGKRAANSS